MNDSIDHLYRRNATQRTSHATDSKVLSLARAHARTTRIRRRAGMVITAAAALAFLVVYTSRHEENNANDALSAHYAEVARPYLLAVKLDAAVDAQPSPVPSDSP